MTQARAERGDRKLIDVGRDATARIFLLVLLLASMGVAFPQVAAWIGGDEYVFRAEEPSPRNIPVMVSEILSDRLGTFALAFPFINEALLDSPYPQNRRFSSDILRSIDLPHVPPDNIALRADDEGRARIFSLDLNRTDDAGGAPHALIELKVQAPQGSPQRYVRYQYVLDEDGLEAYAGVLEDLERNVRRWDTSEVNAYLLTTFTVLRSDNLMALEDIEGFGRDLNMLLPFPLPVSQFDSILWANRSSVSAEGELRANQQYLVLHIGNSTGYEEDTIAYHIHQEDGTIVISNFSSGYRRQVPQQEVPLLAQMFVPASR